MRATLNVHYLEERICATATIDAALPSLVPAMQSSALAPVAQPVVPVSQASAQQSPALQLTTSQSLPYYAVGSLSAAATTSATASVNAILQYRLTHRLTAAPTGAPSNYSTHWFQASPSGRPLTISVINVPAAEIPRPDASGGVATNPSSLNAATGGAATVGTTATSVATPDNLVEGPTASGDMEGVTAAAWRDAPEVGYSAASAAVADMQPSTPRSQSGPSVSSGGATSPGAVLSRLTASVDLVGREASQGSYVTPIVTPSIIVLPGMATNDTAAGSMRVFRVDRTPVSAGRIEVGYQLRLYDDARPITRAGRIVFSDGNAQGLQVRWAPLARKGSSALAVLTLEDGRGYRLGKRAVTMFTAAAPLGSSEAVLFNAFRVGKSAEAFQALVERYRGLVFQTSHRVLGNGHDAEDVTQLVFLALANRQLRLQVSLARWLRVVARNTSIMVLRARRRRARHEHIFAALDGHQFETADDEIREELDTALTQVPGVLQEAVRMRYLEGRSQKEAAELAGCPRGTLAQRATYGVRHLRGVLEQRGNLS